MPETDFSVATLVKGRRKQLHNLLQSIVASDRQPHDIQVVCMDGADDVTIPPQLHNVSLIPVTSSQSLPLAPARNMGFEAAETNSVCFVDVDCIVSPTLFSSLLDKLYADTIVSAYPRYLTVVPDNPAFESLFPSAVPHPARETIRPDVPVPHLKFWSIVFAVRKHNFLRCGGFDQAFTGYGAEDTDFAMSFHEVGLQLIFAHDYVLHQYHDKYDPPLNYFSDIINNARTFHRKWGFYPMGSWLNKFCELGLIAKFDDTTRLSVRRKPTDVEINDCRSAQPY